MSRPVPSRRSSRRIPSRRVDQIRPDYRVSLLRRGDLHRPQKPGVQRVPELRQRQLGGVDRPVLAQSALGAVVSSSLRARGAGTRVARVVMRAEGRVPKGHECSATRPFVWALALKARTPAQKSALLSAPHATTDPDAGTGTDPDPDADPKWSPFLWDFTPHE